MNQSEPPLPQYDLPPVSEVSLGVSFASIEKFKVPHFGLYWEKIRDAYPTADAQPPVPVIMETSKLSESQPNSIQFSSDPNLVRCWFIDESRNNLIQVQPDKYLYNWRQIEGSNQSYPHYEKIRADFERGWKGFREFLRENDLTSPRVIQCEVTYINNLDRGSHWKTFGELGKLITPWRGVPPGGFLPEPDSINFGLVYSMDEPTDRMRVNLQHAVRMNDGTETLQLNLTSRMAPKGEDEKDILACLDKGHDWIVRGFTELTTSEMHSAWKRRF